MGWGCMEAGARTPSGSVDVRVAVQALQHDVALGAAEAAPSGIRGDLPADGCVRERLAARRRIGITLPRLSDDEDGGSKLSPVCELMQRPKAVVHVLAAHCRLAMTLSGRFRPFTLAITHHSSCVFAQARFLTARVRQKTARAWRPRLSRHPAPRLPSRPSTFVHVRPWRRLIVSADTPQRCRGEPRAVDAAAARPTGSPLERSLAPTRGVSSTGADDQLAPA
jgi:hypothetical protein